MRVFVTGGTGLLGNTVIRKLCSSGAEVVALVRQDPAPEVFHDLSVQFVRSELVPDQMAPQSPPLATHSLRAKSQVSQPEVTDNGGATNFNEPASESASGGAIERAIESCDAVIHSAGLIHLGWKKVEQSLRVNRDGTSRIAEACLRYQKKLVCIGTVDTLAVGSSQVVADEETPLDHAGGKVECAYVISKRAQANVIRDAVARGLNAVLIHPGFMLGPWDWKPSSGRMMLEVGTGWKPIAPSGGGSLCDSRDVAAGAIAAIEADCMPGREYILAGYNWTYEHLWREMAKRMGTRPPIRAAGPGLEFLAGLAGDFWGRITGNEPDFNSAGVAMSGQYHWYSSDRARRELGYQNRDPEQTLDDAADWIQQRFVLPRRGAAS